MKVYVVHGYKDKENQVIDEIYGVYGDREKAIDYAIKIAREAFDKCGIKPTNREYSESPNYISICDIEGIDGYYCGMAVEIMVETQSVECDSTSLLRGFMEYEAKFRLKDVHEVPEESITADLIDEVAELLMDDEVFNYDYMDSRINKLLRQKGL